MEECANARSKLNPELVVVKGVDNDRPEKKSDIHWADSRVFHRSVMFSADFILLTGCAVGGSAGVHAG
jgi:hypothetical protein